MKNFIMSVMKVIFFSIAVSFLVCFTISVIDRSGEAYVPNTHTPYGPYEKFIKRPLDFSLALLAVIFLSPVLMILSLLVKLHIGSPVIFTQLRPGLNEKIFTLYKYRSMTMERDENGRLKPDSERLTDFGKIMRSSSLDELPELVNIIRGDMALVGPRPQLVRDMVFMSERHRKRHEVAPGLTGLAQVSGRNAIKWEDKLNKDLVYCQKITFLGDAKIVLQTIKKVLTRDGINEAGQAAASDYGDYLLNCKQVNRREYERLQKEAERIIYEWKRKK